MTTVVTGFRPDGYAEYGRTFIESFCRFWPDYVDLMVYALEPVELCRGSLMPIPRDCAEFLEQHKSDALARGRKHRPGMRWKSAEMERGYSFRYDAWKFCQMAFYTRDAAKHTEDELLVWLDADVVTFSEIPGGFIEGLIGVETVAYLGRNGAHSETGFVAFRLPHAMRLIDEWADLYASGRIFALSEWHSAHAFDIARQTACTEGRNLTPGGRGHVWFHSQLGDYMDHKKGDHRKTMGRSPERRA